MQETRNVEEAKVRNLKETPTAPREPSPTSFKANKSVIASGPCGICGQQHEMGQSVVRCAKCQDVFHSDCWQEEGGCNRAECKGSTKTCPVCGREIKLEALKCRHCKSYLDPEMKDSLTPKGEAPNAKSALTNAIIGIFCFGFVLGPIAVFKGIKVLNVIANDPGYTGRGKAIAAIVIGGIVTLLNIAGIIAKVAG